MLKKRSFIKLQEELHSWEFQTDSRTDGRKDGCMDIIVSERFQINTKSKCLNVTYVVWERCSAGIYCTVWQRQPGRESWPPFSHTAWWCLLWCPWADIRHRCSVVWCGGRRPADRWAGLASWSSLPQALSGPECWCEHGTGTIQIIHGVSKIKEKNNKNELKKDHFIQLTSCFSSPPLKNNNHKLVHNNN